MRKIGILIMSVLTLLIISGCVLDEKTTLAVESIEVVESSVPKGNILVADFELTTIFLRVHYEDNSKKEIPLSASMVTKESLASIQSPGIKTIEVVYESKSTSFTVYLIAEHIDRTGKTVNVMEINDTHGAFVNDGEFAGLNQVSQVIKEKTSAYGEYIKVANGDIFQGSYVSNIHQGKPMIDALNAMGFDAFVIGNHEFDWGIEKIAAYKDGNPDNGEANFEFLAANIVTKNDQKKLSWTKDYVIVENNGYRVGIIGVILDGLESSIATDKVQNYRFLDPVPIVSGLAKKLRSDEKVDVVLVSIHGYKESTNWQLAALTGDSRIDGIIAGHTHQRISEFITRTDDFRIPVVQSQTKNITVGELIFSFENEIVKSAQIRHYYPRDYAMDSSLDEVVEKYQSTIQEGNRVIAYTPEFLSEYRLGMEMTTAMQEKYQADVAIINTGGVRNDIPSGNITVKKIYDVFPFDNYVVRTQMTGSKLKSLYSQSGAYLYFNPGFSSSSLNNTTLYEVVTIDYVYTSSYYESQFRGSVATYEPLTMRDVLIEYLEILN